MNHHVPRQYHTAGMIGGLTLFNAMLFQEVASGFDRRIVPLRQLLDDDDFQSALVNHWHYIVTKVNFSPIFRIAREVLLAIPSSPDLDSAIRTLADRVLVVVQKKAALRHDLMGRIYHRLLLDAKYLGTYYTSVPAATVLLKLALDPEHWPEDQFGQSHVADLRIGDLACGTGTLLMAASEVIADNYILHCVRQAIPPDLPWLHRVLLEDVLHGYDVLASAVHLTASTLALKAPETPFYRTKLKALKLGTVHHRLGSIEFLGSDHIQGSLDLFGEASIGEAVTGHGQVEDMEIVRPTLDLCVMNPPFTRSVGGNLLFGSVPLPQRRAMQRDLARLLRTTRASANSTAGLGAVFVAVGDRTLRPGGRIALVLPKAILSGVAWEPTRQLLLGGYTIEYVVASHDPVHWNFSENTELSEVLIVAQKRNTSSGDSNASPAVFVNLHHNPTTDVEALALAQALKNQSPTELASFQGSGEFTFGENSTGMALQLGQQELRNTPWILPCAFAQGELAKLAYALRSGEVVIPGYGSCGNVPLVRLAELGTLGPDRRDIYDGFEVTNTHTIYPAFWGHDATRVTQIIMEPNAYLQPLDGPKHGRPLRRANDLWPRAGTIMLAERMWLNTQRLVAVRLPARALSNVWWPFAGRSLNIEQEKALVLWLNSTLGLIGLLSCREETRGAWVDFKKPQLQDLPVIDVTHIDGRALSLLSSAFDELGNQELQPLSMMVDDPIRVRIDDAIGAALALSHLDVPRNMLGHEPIVTLRPL